MSHIVTINAKITNPVAIVAACCRLNLEVPVMGTHSVFGAMREGLAIKLPGWTFPIVIETATGMAHYDNYGGRWGKDVELNKFKQAYAIEMARAEARKKGYRMTETITASGAIELHIVTR